MVRTGVVAERPLEIAISGASGLIGRRLTAYLIGGGHRVCRLVREREHAGATAVYWNPATGDCDVGRLAGLDAVVHLAGENIAAGRWTVARQALLRSSRVETTRFLCDHLARLERPPRVLIAASAIGYYGDRGDELLTEESAPGLGFLAEVSREWEAATEPARLAGMRVVNLRIGMVLAREGGALGQMLTPFRLGLGGRIGSGRQYVSWIAREDLVRAVEHLLLATDVAGPVNAVAPQPITNAEFTRALGRVVGRPTLLPLPAWVVRRLFGEMGREVLLVSTRVLPQRLTASRFAFLYEDIESALRAELSGPPDAARQ